MLAFLCSVALLDFVDASIVNVALPSIRGSLHFSVQSLQWVLSAYLLTYGGFMLLGGRAADLVGRRQLLIGGTTLFGLASLAGGLAQSEGMLIGARLAQGVGAAMMIPAALSTLTTSFAEGEDRNKALGAWGAVAGLGSAAGVFLGGVISEELTWRWVFFVNLPICVLDIYLATRLVPRQRHRARLAHFDALGAVLVTSGMLLLTYALVRAPDVGWGSTRTIAELAGAAVLLGLFAIHELRHENPLFPFSILRIKGLAAADLTQVIAMAGFYAMFFFVTLYMQNVLGYTRIEAGAAYLPATFGVAIASAVSAQLFIRVGTRPIIVAGALLGAGGVFWISKVPVDGSYVSDLLPGLLIMSAGLGAVFVGVTTAAQAGVPRDKAGLAAALINASTWLGGALGIAIFSAISTARAHHLLADHASLHQALTSGFQRALLACAIFMLAAAVIAMRATNTKGAPVEAPVPEGEPAVEVV
jgi:EmrB/QacA subfamily drug resistance transporter